MAVTKILPRNGGLKEAIDYVLNGDKTDGHILTAHFNCDPGREYREMMKTKLETGRLDKRQCYHIIQSFKPGEITPELALEIAKAFAQEHLDGFEVVIGTHVDRHHIHSHIVFNSVNADTGEKYHSTLLLVATAVPALAADDPLTVVNNLSDFIFSLIRAIGLILLGFGILQVGLSLKSHDPSQRANGMLTVAGGIVITFTKEILSLITG